MICVKYLAFLDDIRFVTNQVLEPSDPSGQLKHLPLVVLTYLRWVGQMEIVLGSNTDVLLYLSVIT